MRRILRAFVASDDAQGLVEYGLLLVLVGILCLAALDTIGFEVVENMNPINTTLQNASS